MRRRLPAGSRGFTLIELGVTLVILVMVITLVGISIANIRRADLKATSGMMAGAMRYLYNLAVINNTAYRLVVDMDEGSFWGEALDTDDPCARYLPEVGETLESPDEDEERGEPVDPREEKRERAAGRSDASLAAIGELMAAAAPPPAQGSGFKKPKDNLLSERKLPKGIVVTGAITSHHEALQTEGRVAVHFFPGGYAERAWIWLGEQDHAEAEAEVMTTLALEALTGRVTRHTDPLDELDFLKDVDR